MVTEIREYYLAATGGAVSPPFICVMQDGWDSKDHDICGVSIQFADPDTFQLITSAVGLQRCSSKKAVPMANQIEKILLRFGILLSDVFRCVNDTANAAKATGRLVAQKRNGGKGGTSCMLHSQELVLTHALGLVTRSIKGQGVVDSFDLGHNLKTKVKLLLSTVMNKNQKQMIHLWKKPSQN